jgi:hypothetical protein
MSLYTHAQTQTHADIHTCTGTKYYREEERERGSEGDRETGRQGEREGEGERERESYERETCVAHVSDYDVSDCVISWRLPLSLLFPRLQLKPRPNGELRLLVHGACGKACRVLIWMHRVKTFQVMEREGGEAEEEIYCVRCGE